jgi:hypothetical protein
MPVNVGLSPAYILRVKDDQEHLLYARQSLYVGIRRNWSTGSKILLIKRSSQGDYIIIGSATLENIVELDALSKAERKLCIENNWYGKMIFVMLGRFLPAIPIAKTLLAGKPHALLHGLALTCDELSAIENSAESRIIT